MINTTRWRPDTCGCVIEYTWDTEVPAEDRVHTVSTTEPCKEHADLGFKPNDQAHYDAVLAENRMKNDVFTKAVAEVPDMSFTAVDPDTGDLVEKQRVADYRWVFDTDRKLHYTLTRGTPQEKAALDTVVQAEYPTKVNLVTLSDIIVIEEAKAQAIEIEEVIP